VGDRACPCFNQLWHSGPFSEANWTGALGGPHDGVMQEYMLLDQQGVVRAPAHMTDLQAAALPCAAVTAWSAVVDAGGVKAGDVVLIQGTGGVSLFALQIAKLHGAAVIATSSSDAKLERLKALGADHVINYRDTPDWGKAAAELTGGHGVDIVVEVGGAGTLAQSVRAVRPNGAISLIGNLSGTVTEVNLAFVFMKWARLLGIALGSRDAFEAMLRAFALHRLEPVVDDQVYGFEDLRAALKALPTGQHFGKVCLRF
jgi:NADPH:quinone reductase-like Zn-dependent oxidoreductase